MLTRDSICSTDELTSVWLSILQRALALLTKKYTNETGTKRKQNGDPSDEEDAQKKLRATEEGEEFDLAEGSITDHSQVRLAQEVRERPATNAANQKLVDAFLAYGEQQLNRGHTGKGTSHLRAAKYIRDFDGAIRSGSDALEVEYVGNKMAKQVEDILRTGKIQDSSPETNVSDQSMHSTPELVSAVRDTPAKCKENQKIVDALANFGEHELYFGNSGKGVSHLRAALEIHDSDSVIRSAQDARALVALVGDVIGDKIEQILEHGKIIYDTDSTGSGGSRRPSGSPAPIVEYLLTHPAKNPANQNIVQALVDYGDSHLQSGHRGKGISHLRAAKEICHSDHEIRSGADAKRIGMVGDQVAAKIDQILQQGHADSDEDYEDDEDEEEGGEEYDQDEGMEEGEPQREEEGSGARQQRGGKRGKRGSHKSEYGHRERDLHSAPIIRDIRRASAEVASNQKLVDALTDYAEDQLSKRHTGRGITFARAARQMRDATAEVTSGKDAKSIGMIGDKVAQFIDNQLSKGRRGASAP